MHLTETYSRVQVRKNLTGSLLGMAFNKETLLSLLLFNFTLDYAIRRAQVNQDGLKLNSTHRLLAYANDVIVLGGSIHTLKENTEAVVAATRQNGQEVSGDKTKYVVMC